MSLIVLSIFDSSAKLLITWFSASHVSMVMFAVPGVHGLRSQFL